MFEINQDGDTVYLSGRFDASQVDNAKQVFDDVNGDVVADFSALDYISSAGLGVLLATQKRLVASGHTMKITHLNHHIREIFRIAGFDRVFAIE